MSRLDTDQYVVSYVFLSVGTVGAVRCVRTINSVKVFVESNFYVPDGPPATPLELSKGFSNLLSNGMIIN